MKEYLEVRRWISLTACLSAAIALGAASGAAAQGYSISQVPLVLPSALDPNILLTMDDSPNMARAYADTMGGTSYATGFAGDAAPANTRRFKSSAFNPLYYDPTKTYVAPAGAMTTMSTFDNAWVNGFYQAGNSWKLDFGQKKKYRPTLSYDGSTDTPVYADHYSADKGAIGATSVNTGGDPYYYKFDSSKFGTGTCPASVGSITNDDCYTLVIVSSSSGPGGTDELQNFANWYSYYRTRHLSMVSSAWRVLSDPALSGTRVGWQALTACKSFASGNTCVGYDSSSNPVSPEISNLIDEFTNARLTDLQNWLRRLRPAAAGTNPATPLRSALWRAGQYYSTTASPNDPFLKFPQLAYDSTTNPRLSCRPNFHIMVAGSPWTDDTNVSLSPFTTTNFCGSGACGNGGNVDGGSMTWPDATLYSTSPRTVPANTPPWGDTNQNSLADIAMYYWLNDLRPLPNNLLPFFGDRTANTVQELNPVNDPAVWQHMVNYVVGVGLKNSVSTSPLPPALGWPTTGAGLAGNLYDLWHAAINSRGGYFGADTPAQLIDALTNSLSRAAPINANSNFVGTALATNSTRLATDSALYQAQFKVDDWTGRLGRIPVDTSGQTTCQIGGSPACVDAADSIPPYGSRKIFTWTGSAGAAFTQAGLTTAGVWNAFGADDTVRGYVVDYLRGDQTKEGPNPGDFRIRSKKLGDIVNSDIVFSGGENFGYGNLSPDNYDTSNVYLNSYNNYVAATQSRTKMIYVGANDGMLHGFNATTMEEQFAYVPRSVLKDTISPTDSRAALVQLTDPSYNGNHRFFVDGSPWVGDACLKVPASNCTFTNLSTTDWRTVLVGTTGAGQRGVFALDVTNPTSFAAANVLWDLTGQSDNDLGYTIGQPVIGRLNDGNYYAIFGNGYLSPNGCAVLYLVRLADGVVRRISVAEGNLGSGNSAAACANTNGLGRPSLFDSDSNRTTEAIYAADMLGQLWKFDVSDTDPAKWVVHTKEGSARVPLFTARNKCGGVQPITSLIEIGAPPSGETGAMIYFGTGRFLSADDRTDTTRQSFYGILDRNSSTSRLNKPPAAATGDTTCATAPGTDLSYRGTANGSDSAKLVEQTLSAFSSGTRTVSSNSVVYTSGTNNGWYVDLAVTDPVTGVRAGERVVSAPTLLAGRIVFSTLIPSSDICAGGGNSTVVALDPFKGGKTSKNIFVDTGQAGYDSFKLNYGIVKNLIAIDSGTNVFLFAGGSSGNVQSITTISQQATGGSIRGRTAWREIFQ